jgi:hypothetical protein
VDYLLGEVLRSIVEVLETKDVDLTRETELNKTTSTGSTAHAELLKARLRGLEATGESMGSARGVLEIDFRAAKRGLNYTIEKSSCFPPSCPSASLLKPPNFLVSNIVMIRAYGQLHPLLHLLSLLVHHPSHILHRISPHQQSQR